MQPSDLRIPGVKKIAVVRANALGDFIFSLPALYSLQAAYPDAETVLVGKQWHAGFLENRPGPVKRVITVPRYRGVSEPDTWQGPDPQEQAEIDRFFDQVQKEQFDLALQMHGGGAHSNPFILKIGARFTAGMRTPNAPVLDRWMPYHYWQHEIMRQLEVVGLVGARPIMLEPFLEVTGRDRAESCDAVPDQVKPIVIIHPGASDPRRRWAAGRFAAVGDVLARRGYQVMVVGIPSETDVVRAVLQNMKEPAWDLCGKLSLHALTGLISRARLIVANDSGPRHLAEAVGTPSVAIYWCGNLINAGSLFRARHRPHLSWRINCPVCWKNTLQEPCMHKESFVDEVTIEEVTASALDVLSTSRA